MEYRKEYEIWLEKADEETRSELLAITDEKELEDRFYKNLEFGTGGLRGVIGAGTNRINRYVVRRATQGLADYMKSYGEESCKRGVSIAYDSRRFSDIFALEAALVLAANGIKAYLFEGLRPVPELSFTVRHLHTLAGIEITASHNPKKYNGYKVYFEDGGQLPPHVSDKVLEYINKIDPFTVPTISREEAMEKGLLVMLGEEVDNAYLSEVLKQQICPDIDKSDFSMVYTPLHGSGNIPVRRALQMAGFENILLVEEQLEPNGEFPTVNVPNPENADCFDLAVELAKKQSVDLIIGTDPDCDRVGVMVRSSSGDYVTLTGNQVGALLTDYIITQRKAQGTLPNNGAVISTIVSTKMTSAICKANGVDFLEVLTGFKFIGNEIYRFEQEGCNTYLFGFEESYGYLAGTHARDKDGVVGSLLIAEMSVYYAKQGKTLYDAMEELYARYGYFLEKTVSITKDSMDGLAEIQAIMTSLRENTPAELGGKKVTAWRDYQSSKRYEGGKEEVLTLPRSNVLYFELEGGSAFVARPSGTEPKIKLYLLTTGNTKEEAQTLLDKLTEEAKRYAE